MNIPPPLHINGLSLDTDKAQDVSEKISGTHHAVINESNTVARIDEPEVDLKKLAPNKIIIEMSGYRPQDRLKNSDNAKAALTSYIEILTLSTQAKDQHTHVTKLLAQERPSLIGKTWDFSLDANNKVVVSHNGDLQNSDVVWLQDRLQYSALKETLTALKASMLMHIEVHRGPDNASFGIGRYDLSENNFNKIIRFGEFLNKTNGADGFQIFLEQLQARATDTSSERIYSYLEKDGSITRTTEKRT